MFFVPAVWENVFFGLLHREIRPGKDHWIQGDRTYPVFHIRNLEERLFPAARGCRTLPCRDGFNRMHTGSLHR